MTGMAFPIRRPHSRMGLGSIPPSNADRLCQYRLKRQVLEAFDDTVLFYATLSFLTAGWVSSVENVFLSLNSSCLPLFQFLTGR